MLNKKYQTPILKNSSIKNNTLITQFNQNKTANLTKYCNDISLRKDESKHCTLNDLKKSHVNSPKYCQTTKNDILQLNHKNNKTGTFTITKNIQRHLTNNNYNKNSATNKSGVALNKITFNASSLYDNNLEDLSNTINKTKGIKKKNKNSIIQKTNKDLNFLLVNDYNELNSTDNKDKISINETKISRISSNPFFNKGDSNANCQNYIKDINDILTDDSNKKINVIKFGEDIKHSPTFQNNLKIKDIINNVNKNSINITNTEIGESYQNLNDNSGNDSTIDKFQFLDNQNHNNTSNESLYRNYLIMSKKGDKDKFLELLGKIMSLPQNLSNIDFKDENGYSALHYSCEQGNLKIAEILVKTNSNLNIRTNSEMTPLHLATKKGFFDITKLLIEHGAKINVVDNEKNTPLHYICMNNHIDLLKYILGKNPKINIENIYKKKPIDLTSNKEMKQLIIDYKKNHPKKYSLNENLNVSPKHRKIKINDAPENENILVNSTQNNININIQTNADKEDISNASKKENRTKIFNIKKEKFRTLNSNIIINVADHLNYSYNESKNPNNLSNKLNESDNLNNNSNKKKVKIIKISQKIILI